MKHALSKAILPVLLMGAGGAHAQLKKGNLMVGATVGDISFSALGSGLGSAFGIDLSPRLGYFIADQAVVGASLRADYYRSEGYSELGFGLTPFLRYFLRSSPAGVPGKAVPFVEAGLGYRWRRQAVETPASTISTPVYDPVSGQIINSTTTIPASTQVYSGGNGLAYLSGGLDFFLNQSVALEGALRYGYKDGGGRHNLGVNLGFQIFLGQGQLFGRKSSPTSSAAEDVPPPSPPPPATRPSTTPSRTAPATTPSRTAPSTTPRSTTTPRSGSGTTLRRTAPSRRAPSRTR